MSRAIECAGHPRDMGSAQGRALAERIRAEVARRGLPTRRSRIPSLRAVVSGPLRGQGAGRELFRHFAHQAERLEGLAQAAELPIDSVLALQLRAGDGATGIDDRDSGRVADDPGWIVRESRPVVGFRSLEVTRPWLVAAVAGVNAAGLAVMIEASDGAAARDATRTGGVPVERDDGARGAPPILLVQDCLARFENLAGAIDWCCKRPVGGGAVVSLADATGERTRIVLSGGTRRVERVDRSASGTAPTAGDAWPLARLLGDTSRSDPVDRVELDPVGRRLRVDLRLDVASSDRHRLELVLGPESPPLHPS